MNWNDLLIDDKPITSIFGDTPTLNSVDLMAFEFSRDGPTLKLTLDLADYPEQPPAKWKLSKFNTVQLVLGFGGVEDPKIDGAKSNIRVDIDIQEEGEKKFLSVAGDLRISMQFQSVWIVKVSGYQDSLKNTLVN